MELDSSRFDSGRNVAFRWISLLAAMMFTGLITNPLLASTTNQEGLTNSPSLEATVTQVSVTAPAELTALLTQKRPSSGGEASKSQVLSSLITDDFESTFPSGLWWNYSQGAAGCNWDRTDADSWSGSWSISPVAADCAGNPTGPYPDNVDSWAIYGPFDLSIDVVSAEMEFLLKYDLQSGDIFQFMSSTDGSTFSGYEIAGGGDFSTWFQVPYDLAPEVGEDEVWIALILRTDGTSSADQGVLVDDFSITIDDGVHPPEIEVRPLDLSYAEDIPGVSQVLSGNFTRVQQPTVPDLDAALAEIDPVLADKGNVRIIVQFNVPDSLQSLQALASKDVARDQWRGQISTAQQQLENDLSNTNAQINARYTAIPYMALTVEKAALQQLLNSPSVVSVELDRLSKPYMDSSNDVIGSPLAWAEGLDGSGWAVAVLDTGVDSSHPWLSTGGSKVISEACYSSNGNGYESLCPGGVISSTAVGSGEECDAAVDGCSHGTHVAGTIAGNDGAGPGFGVAQGAEIIAMQVFTRFNNNSDCDGNAPCVASWSSDQIKAMDRLLVLSDTINIAAANMSLGGGRYYNQAACDSSNNSTKAAIDALRAKGIATVIAAGNDGYTDSIGSPGCISSAISVGATTDGDSVASFSNIYPEIHLLAPGVSITSSVPGGGTANWQGTSMATPHVAGAWAVMKQRNPTATVSDVLAEFQSTGTNVDDNRSGGVESEMPRINLDLAIGEPRTTFGIFNRGLGELTVSSITPDSSAPWISWSPQAPFIVEAGGLQVVTVMIDYSQVPEGITERQLLITSNDSGSTPYPNGVNISVDSYDGPEAPTSVGASDGSFVEHVSVAWTGSIEAGGNFEVYRCDDDTLATCSKIAEPSSNSYDDTGADAGGSTHYYRVIACETDCSGFSTSDTGFRALPPPDAPDGVMASDATHFEKVAVSWNQVNDADSFEVYRCSGTGVETCVQINTNPAGVVDYDDIGADADGTVHYYRIKACHNSNGCSDFSDSDTGNRRKPPPPVPDGVSATDGEFLDKVVVTWNDVEGEDSYTIFRCSSAELNTCGPLAVVSADVTIFEHTDADDEGAVEYYRVRSCIEGHGCSESSEVASGFRAVPPPIVPTGVTASDAEFLDKVSITWDDVDDEDSYLIFRCDTADLGSCTEIDVVDFDITFYDDTDADAEGGEHFYRVKACMEFQNCSDFSEADTGSRDYVPPPPPPELIFEDSFDAS